MEKMKSLIAFVGMRDPYPETDDEPGPLLALLLSASRGGRPYDEAWLLCTGGNFLERARDLEREAREEGIDTEFRFRDFPVRDVIDYAEIWGLLGPALALITAEAGSRPRDWAFLLDSGTPQMKTTLFLAARAGLFPATLLQGIPPRFAGGTYKVREVRIEGIPDISLHIDDAESLQGPSRASRRGEGRIFAPEPGKTPVRPVASSEAFAEALRKAVSASRYDDPVLLLGETGTGKTMIARRIHGESTRKAGPFVEVNCSAIAASLAESELFGNVRGAYTGAEKARSGKFRAAQGGSLFLDEVGDLSLELQAKLLKALEDKAVTPVGSDEPLEADARLIAATNRDLPGMIKEGKFRRDLYERLKVVVISLPPLRERREDIRGLAQLFLSAWNEQYGERRFLTEDAMILLEAHSWPGNVRELQNALRSAACSATSEALGPESLSDEIRRACGEGRGQGSGFSGGGEPELPEGGLNLRARLLQVEWEYVAAALRKAGGNREAAAGMLGMTGHAFRKALKERLAVFLDEGMEEGM